jgi:integrase
MARTPRPWYRAERDEWRVIVRGTDHCLGNHPAGFPAPRKQRGKWNVPQPVVDRFHELLATKADVVPPLSEPDRIAVADVFEKFLDWCSKNRSERTYEWSRNHIQSFITALKARKIGPAEFPAEELRPFHVNEWVDSHKVVLAGRRPWGPNHCRGAITAVQRAFSWAESQGHIAKSPIRHIEKPPPRRREQVLSPADFDRLLGLVTDEPFRDVLEFCWETGCRVQEVRQLETAHYKPERGRFELPPDKTKGKKRWRLIYLTPRATEIVTRLAPLRPAGPIFRNADGNAWTAASFNNRFCRIQKRLGREHLGKATPDAARVKVLADALPKQRKVAGVSVAKTEKELLREARKKLSARAAAKLGAKYALTAIRHSFCQRLLEAGVDHTTVAALMGHSNAVMVATTYSHMDQAKDFLREELLRASGARTSAA